MFEGLNLKAGGDIAPSRFIKVSAANTATQCSAGTDYSIGVSFESVEDSLGQIGSAVYHRTSTSKPGVGFYPAGRKCLVEAGNSFSAGAALMPDSVGRAITATSTNLGCAIALESATAAGQLIPVLVISPYRLA